MNLLENWNATKVLIEFGVIESNVLIHSDKMVTIARFIYQRSSLSMMERKTQIPMAFECLDDKPIKNLIFEWNANVIWWWRLGIGDSDGDLWWKNLFSHKIIHFTVPHFVRVSKEPKIPCSMFGHWILTELLFV